MTEENPNLREVSEHEFVVEHTIRSPPERIFEAYTEPDLVVQWWAHPGQTLRVDEMDVRPGGKWRFTHLLGDGKEMVMHGEHRDVDPVTRLSDTYNKGEGTDEEILAIVDLEAVESGTHITLTNRCGSREQRDGMLSYGAEQGASCVGALGRPAAEGLNMSSDDEPESHSELIDLRLEELADWQAEELSRIRGLIKEVDPDGVGGKWRKPSNPMGVPVWSPDGTICTGETYKNKVKLTFAKGASLEDPVGLFNASPGGNTRRAIDIHEGDEIDENAFKSLVRAAVALNES